MRGEDVLLDAELVDEVGSPPHARGRHRRNDDGKPEDRITPACAGKTFCLVEGAIPSWDHPRMRGEDKPGTASAKPVWGSPPHARGRLRHDGRPYAAFRITPACAGKTPAFPRAGHLAADHPRMRGEDIQDNQNEEVQEGSPPHARGRRSWPGVVSGSTGITPACAGKTAQRKTRGTTRSDHPRMRGEDTSLMGTPSGSQGSPPHARGRHVLSGQLELRLGITPACAGKTSALGGQTASKTDHPRMRGEDFNFFSYKKCAPGSPPHARGRHAGFQRVRVFFGITPACAGKTAVESQKNAGSSDHPRMRGEDRAIAAAPTGVTGSPPHARGRPCS